MNVIWSARGRSDLRDILAYIMIDRPVAARRVGRRISDAALSLDTMPRRGRPVRLADTRELVVRGLPYVLIYRVGAADVEILRVLHGARDWPASAGD